MRILILFLLFGITFGNVDENDLAKTNLTKYVDSFLPTIKKILTENGFEPMEIPDLRNGFSVKPLFITYHGELKLTNGKLTGLTSLARTKDFQISYLNKMFRIEGDFDFENIAFTYNYLAEVMSIGRKGGVVGKVSKISGVIDLLFDFNKDEVRLQNFYLYNVGSISVKLTGHFLTDWLGNIIISVVNSLFKRVIVSIIETNLKDIMQEKFDEISNALNKSQDFAKFKNMVYEYERLQNLKNGIFKFLPL